jgi:hypothetical protein
MKRRVAVRFAKLLDEHNHEARWFCDPFPLTSGLYGRHSRSVSLFHIQLIMVHTDEGRILQIRNRHSHNW